MDNIKQAMDKITDIAINALQSGEHDLYDECKQILFLLEKEHDRVYYNLKKEVSYGN